MKKILASVVSFLPALAFAADAVPDSNAISFANVPSAIAAVSAIVDRIIPLIIGIAVLLFLIGVLKFVTAGGDEEAREAARGMIIFGIIALFVMVCVWGFVKILKSTFFGGTDVTTAPLSPKGFPNNDSVNF